MKRKLRIKAFCLGDWATNCYVVHPVAATGDRDDITHRVESDASAQTADPAPCWIIDAGFGPDAMIQYIQSQHAVPQAVILTHAHVDHIAGLETVRQAWPDVPILIHHAEAAFLTDPALNLSIMLDQPIVAPEATDTLKHGQTLHLDGTAFEVRHTPGHSPGGITLVQPDINVAFVGDALFAGSIGRTDFPTSDHDTLLQSIRTQLLTLPGHTRVLPGHGGTSTIDQESRSNPFL